MPKPTLTLITGPARSGKSEWAEYLAASSGSQVTYIATAQSDPEDSEWTARLAKHRQRRPAAWRTREVPVKLAEAIAAAHSEECLLIDSLGTWLANLLDQDEAAWAATSDELLKILRNPPSQVILVAEETGWGVTPAYPLGRRFRDRLGHLTRHIAGVAQTAYLMVAGYAIDLHRIGFQASMVHPQSGHHSQQPYENS